MRLIPDKNNTPKIDYGIDSSFASVELSLGRLSQKTREKIRVLFLSCRRDGGEDHSPAGKLCIWFRQALGREPQDAIRNKLGQHASQYASSPKAQVLVRALQAILDGSRDPALADTPGFNYELVAEIRLILEKVEVQR